MAWLILATSLATLATHRLISALLLLLAIGMAFFSGILGWQAIVLLAFIILLGAIRVRFSSNLTIKVMSEIMLVACAIGLFIHLFPGFNNQRYLDKVFIGPQSSPFTMYLNFDKALIPFILLACLPTLFSTQPVKTATSTQWALLIVSVPLLLIIAALAGGLGFEAHFPTWLPAFVICNLFFVALAEEALFRGYLQQRLTLWLRSPYLALILSSLLFGGLHFAGGPLLILFATLAGVIYGLTWLWSGKLWLAVSIHFGLNLIHLLFFTYPVKMMAG
ncbi:MULTISPECIES: CPBP family intramembrane glutamic endopeptidase [Providencia]|uniref:CPBP family intramembrane glutamic endopeptidase n=1 Tax=Providencia TaxID=586 RepID=UPI0008388491|nr:MULTISPECIES: CPBP family intramembrane glutamic endopeptidase [Providencia]MBP6121041.1 CPBP family intramembrane metalloprotease [Providencia sp.]NIH23583.1 CPBP family intramembrane metalloprotease [Providencia heimbachae]